MKRARVLIFAVAVLATTTTLVKADPYPVVGEPVLKSDSLFERTDWGYKLKTLAFPSDPHPTIFTMEGYDGASRPAPNAYLRMDDGELIALKITFGAGPRHDYASVQASIRGTECSGGSFNLYDRRHAWDGYHIVEWVAEQAWSNGKVGEFGSSFPGQTAYWVAATQPPHLAAVSANLLHSDIYRDIFMPGGVQNYLFPSLWTYAVGPHRLPQTSYQNFQNDEICVQMQASRYLPPYDLPQAQNEPAFAAVRSTDDDWYVDHAAITFAPAIKIPYYQQVDWQDEQVGPRAVVLFNHIHPDPVEITTRSGARKVIEPKKFVTSNGDHGHGNFAGHDRWNFFDIFLLGMPDSAGLMDSKITNYFEVNNNGDQFAATKSGDSWPFADTTWTKSYLHGDGTMDFSTPSATEASQSYVTGAARQNFFDYAPENFGSDVTTARGLPDQLEYLTAPVGQNFTVGGPIMMNLSASMAGTDADFYVSISDVFPDGKQSFLQRGLLKASHRAVDPKRSYYAADGTTMVQPYMPHTNPQPITPGEIVDYKIEIFPLGYIFRAGHRILIQIHTPPVLEKIWGYTPTHHQPAAVTVYHDAAHPTWIQWPVVQTDAPIVGDVTPCPLPGGFYCAPPSALN